MKRVRKILAYFSPGIAITAVVSLVLVMSLDYYAYDWVASFKNGTVMVLFKSVLSIFLGIGVSGLLFSVLRCISSQKQPKTKEESGKRAQNYFWVYVVLSSWAMLLTLEGDRDYSSAVLAIYYICTIIGGILSAIYLSYYSVKHPFPPLGRKAS